MNKEQELKVELLSIQREKLVSKVNNIKSQICQLDEKIDRIRSFSNNQQSRPGRQSDEGINTSRTRNSSETTMFQ